MPQWLTSKVSELMPKPNKFYAVAHGRKIGIFDSWNLCKQMVDGFPNARYKCLKTQEEAEAFIRKNSKVTDLLDIPTVSSVKPLASNHTVASSSSSAAALAAVGECSELHMGNPVVGKKRPRSSPDPVGLLPFSDEWLIAREEESTVVYIDGACSSNGRHAAHAGFGGFYGDGDPRNFSFALCANEAHTNNRAELHALIYVLRAALDCGGRCENLCVYTDSKYVLDGAMRYIRRWLCNGFKLACGKPVLNQDLWLALSHVREQHTARYAARLTVEHNLLPADAQKAAERLALRLVYVPGHSGVRGNEMADHLAVRGAAGKIKRPPVGNEEPCEEAKVN